MLYLSSRVDFHPHHRKVAQRVALTLADGGGPLVRACQVQVPLTSVLVNLVAVTSPVAADLARTLDAYASQRVTVGSFFRRGRYAGKFHGRGHEVEELWALPAARCRALHLAPPRRWFTSGYRGLRPNPLTDPLAYLVARSARRAPARSVGGTGFPTDTPGT